LSDDVYVDGNNQNDNSEYTEVYNSDEEGFDGIVSGPETIEATFDPVTARYVKITFENARTAVDEIEVFMIRPSDYASHTTRRPREKDTRAPSTVTPVPTKTLLPSRTPTKIIPTKTLLPTYTSTPRPPTDTPEPTDTPVPPTNTPRPPTDTPEPPTDTPESPTDTPEPPTEPPPPPPTDTAEPPTTVPETQAAPTDTQSAPADTPASTVEP
jgi:hypothetical protein